MSNLFMWEYNGETEYGVCVNKYCATGKREFRWLNGAITRREDSITDLCPAKVVDADAVVISKDEFEALEVILESAQHANHWVIPTEDFDSSRLLKRLIKTITPPITEPKNFGAIVEAGKAPSFARQKFVKLVGVAGATWFDEVSASYFDWSDLINPVIISEGITE